jgi:hypothetical protein
MKRTIYNKIYIFIISAIILLSSINIVNSTRTVEFENNSNNEFDYILSLIEQVNESLISNYLEGIVSFGPRYTGTESCRKSAEYIFNEFKNQGLNVSYQKWNSLGFSSQNVIGSLNNKESNIDSTIIICAHYDTTETSSGANDDGSGIASLLTLSNIFSKVSLNHTLRFIAASGEEIGTFGSHFYSKYCYDNGDDIIAVINLDTIGYTTDNGGNFLYLLKTDRSQWIASMTQEICNEFGDFVNLIVKPIANRRNDHQSFIEYGFDAVQFVQLERGDYPLHTPEDTLDKINYSYLTKVVKLVLILSYKIGKKEFDIRVRINSPKEGYLYFLNNPIINLPGFNIRGTGLRGMTYLIGKTIAGIDISTNENISSVAYCIDGHSSFSGFLQEPPFEWIIEKSYWTIMPLFGKHILSVYVTTENGNIAYDEMDIFII